MAAPLGNKFWAMRSSHGRSPKFDNADDLWKACSEYFDWVDQNPLYESQAFAYQGAVKLETVPKMRAMTVAGLCVFLDINRTTWEAYRTKEDLRPVTTRVDEIIRDQKFAGAAAGLLNANIIARDLGLADRQEHTGRDGGPIQTEHKPDFGDLDPDERDALRAILVARADKSESGAN